jgi:hypothetical protein
MMSSSPTYASEGWLERDIEAHPKKFNFSLQDPQGRPLDGLPHLIFVLCEPQHLAVNVQRVLLSQHDPSQVAPHAKSTYIVVMPRDGLAPGCWVGMQQYLAEGFDFPLYFSHWPTTLALRETGNHMTTMTATFARAYMSLQSAFERESGYHLPARRLKAIDDFIRSVSDEEAQRPGFFRAFQGFERAYASRADEDVAVAVENMKQVLSPKAQKMLSALYSERVVGGAFLAWGHHALAGRLERLLGADDIGDESTYEVVYASRSQGGRVHTERLIATNELRGVYPHAFSSIWEPSCAESCPVPTSTIRWTTETREAEKELTDALRGSYAEQILLWKIRYTPFYDYAWRLPTHGEARDSMETSETEDNVYEALRVPLAPEPASASRGAARVSPVTYAAGVGEGSPPAPKRRRTDR